MEFAQKWQQRSPLIRRLAAFQESPLYPMLYALLCAISGLGNKYVYLPILGILTVFIVFSALFVRDNKVFLVPMFMVFCSLGCDNVESARDGFRTNVIGVFDTDAFVVICVLGVIMVSSLLIRVCRDGLLADTLTHRGPFLYGFLAISAALLLNGCFSDTWQLSDTALGLFLAFGFIGIYCLTRSMLKSSKDVINYACICMVCTACLVVVQIAVLLLRLHAEDLLIVRYQTLPPRLRRENIQLAWGYATNIAGVVALGIPAAMYLARHRRHPIPYCLLAGLFWLTTLVVGTRSAFFAGALVLIACALICSFGSKNARYIRLFSLIVLLSGIALVLYLNQSVLSLNSIWDDVLKFLRLDDLKSLDRFPLWENGWQDFLDAPVFGVGFSDGGVIEKTETSQVFGDMYHNIILEFLGAMGAVGLLSFIWHLRDFAACLFKRRSWDKVLILLIPMMILVTSLVDNFFFYINFQIFYCVFLVLAEHQSGRVPTQPFA